MENFDFDEWSALARVAPEEFESRRHSAIERVIAGCKNKRRLRGLQCRIDLERARSRTPLNACLRLSTLMWDSFYECHHHLNRLAYGIEHHALPLMTQPHSSAAILPFRRPSINGIDTPRP
jgi:hypothetical protein